MKCLPWAHKWTRWSAPKPLTPDSWLDNVTTIQTRRCKNCNKVQTRVP